MNHFTRRKFLSTSAVLLGTSITGFSFAENKDYPRLSFSTLGCPDWSFKEIVDFAAAHKYKGIEIRGIQRELDLTKCSTFSNAKNKKATLALMKEKRLEFVGLGSSANLHFAEGRERIKNMDEARRFIDLAHEINCPFVRVFPNNFPKAQDRNATIELITKGLLELGDFSKNSKVMVLMETHGDLVKSEDLEKIMRHAAHAHTGLVWDIANMWSVTKEAPADVYQNLKKYIHHTHIKDGNMVDGKLQYTLLGQGEVPVFDAIDLLKNGNYRGYYSFEWEKLWHPEIAEPEIALADYPKVIKEHFNE
jgi:sugar phosphate isomerase/epimerase